MTYNILYKRNKPCLCCNLTYLFYNIIHTKGSVHIIDTAFLNSSKD